MKEVTVVKVSGRREMDDFLNVPDIIYAGCAQYVPDMRSDVRAMFAPKTDAGENTPTLQPFVAYKGKDVVGRVVGVINHKANKTWNTRYVRFSMIEFIDDLEVSRPCSTPWLPGERTSAWRRCRGRWASPTSTKKACS